LTPRGQTARSTGTAGKRLLSRRGAGGGGPVIASVRLQRTVVSPLFHSRRRFVLISGAGWGMPMWLLVVWLTWDLRGFGWWLFLLIVCVAGGLLWGVCMWYYVKSPHRNAPKWNG
jgi:hypothetical protein